MTTNMTIARTGAASIAGMLAVTACIGGSSGDAPDDTATVATAAVSTDPVPTSTDSTTTNAPTSSSSTTTSTTTSSTTTISSTTTTEPDSGLPSVGDCSTADPVGSGAGRAEVVDCSSADAKSQVTEIVASVEDCSSAYLTFTGTDDVFCLETFVSESSAEFAALQSVDALLAAQVEALTNGDDEAFAALLGPDVDEEILPAAGNTSILPIASIEMAVGSGSRIDESDAADGEIDRLPIEMTFDFEGLDDNAFVYRAEYDLVADGNGDGYIVTDIDFSDQPPFWFANRLAVEETEHFYGLALESSTELGALMIEAEDAFAAIAQTPIPMIDKSLIYLTDTQSDFRDLTGRGRRTLGLAASYYQLEGSEFTVGNRIAYINGEAFVENDGNADRPATIRHELVHLMLSRTARPFTPAWLAEGVAVYYAGQLSDERRVALSTDPAYAEISLDALTSAEQLGENDFLGERVGAEYLFSGEVFAYVVDEFGDEAALALHDSYAAVDLTPVVDELPPFGTSMALDNALGDLTIDVTPQLLQDQFGLDLAALEAAVRERIG